MPVAREASRALWKLSLHYRRALGGERELAVQRLILALRPEFARSVARAAILYQERGHPERASRLWKRMTELRPIHALAWAQLARLTLQGGDAGEALRVARRGQKHVGGAGRLWGAEPYLASLVAELERGPTGIPARHVVICGVAHCGSTIMSYLLGSLPEAGNVGESHWLINRYDEGGSAPIDFDGEGLEGASVCKRCSVECPVWTPAFRRELAADPVGWYGKLAQRLDVRLLVSSDKNHPKLVRLDPLLRFDALVLFRDPAAVWASTRVGERNRKDIHKFLAGYEREYLRLLNDLPVRGRKLVLSFDRFRNAPGPHLERMGVALDLPLDAQLHERIRSDQHSLGGNIQANRTVHGEAPRIVPQAAIELPEDERSLVARFAQRSPVLRELSRAHDEVFGAVEGGR